MSQPTPYTTSTDFSQQEAINASGRSTVNTSALDAELANIETTLDQALANMALLQRDDGRLKDLACEVHTLSPEVLNLMGGFRARGLWTAGTAYSVKDIASNAEYVYLCKTEHTSGPEFDEQFWTRFGFSGGADAAQAAAAAQVSANNASLSAGAAATSAGAANTAASAAATQAGSAATSAGTATTQAGNAATSATNASNSAAAAQTAAANLPNAPAAGANKFLKSNADGTVWEYLTALAARSALGLAIGTDVMAYVAPGTAGNVLTSTGSEWSSVPSGTRQIQPIAASVASNALTLTLNPTKLDFRSATLPSGDTTTLVVDPAITLVVPSGATLGTLASKSARLITLAINNAGTVELAVVNQAGSLNLDETALISTTAISVAADSDNVVYSTTAHTNVPFRVVGFVDIVEATPGTWATAATLVQGAGGQSFSAFESGRSWHIVTGSRISGTTYFNTTGKRIDFCVTTLLSNTSLTMGIEGNTIVAVQSSSNYTASGCLPVDPGESYYANYGGSGSMWWEKY